MTRSRKRFASLAVCALVVAAVVLAATGILGRRNAMAALRQETAESSIEDVSVVLPRGAEPTRTLDLPGDVSAWYQAPIYAQVSGYVKMWDKDYGAAVKAGDVLATINTPSLDAQYRASKAQLDVAMAKYNLAELTAKRWKALEGTQAVSRQQVDVQAANAKTEKAEVEAAQHDLAKFVAMEGFKTIVAPFDGVVTSRMINVGDFVSEAGGNMGAHGEAAELFSVADIHKLRVFVSVPQDYADILKQGLKAEITVPQFPGRTFHADFLTAAWAFDTSSRTVTTELTLENKDHELWPGSYAQVHFVVPSDPKILILPENALIFQERGEQVAVVDKNNRLVMKDVKVGKNLGADVEILGGLSADDKVVNNPSAGLLNGDLVRVVDATRGYNKAEAGGGQAGGSQQ